MAVNTTALQQQVSSDPDYQRVMAEVQKLNAPIAQGGGGGVWQGSQAYADLMALNQKYQQQGILPKGYSVNFGGEVGQGDFMSRHSTALSALSLLPAGLGLGLAAAGGGAAAPALTADGTLPATATVGATGALAPAVAPALDAAAGTTTAAASGAGGILGALGKYGGLAGDLGGVLTNAASASANANRQNAANNARGIAENNAAKTEAAKYNLSLPSVRTNQVSRGEVLNTMKDAPLTGDPRIDKFSGGGLIPSAFGPQSRAAGAELSRQAMSGLMNPSQDRLTPQEIPPYNGSTLDNVAGGAGLGLDIFSLLSKYGGKL